MTIEAREEETIPETAAPPPREPKATDPTAWTGAAFAPRLYRSADGRLLAGVAQGLAQHLHLRPLLVRAIFVGLSLFGGFGVLLYIGYWAVVPLAPAYDARRRRRSTVDRGGAVALAVLALGVVLLLRGAPIFRHSALLIPLLLAAAGLAVMWRQADEAQRGRWLQMPSQLGGVVEGRSRRMMVLRIVGGAALVIAGIATFLTLSGRWAATRDGLVAIVVVLAGVGLLTGPWWWRLVADLSAERRERIRSQERAELAAHLHDSVLQTLALIQRHVDSPREVARLARGQERELRAWLYRPDSRPESRFAAAMEEVSAEVEDAYAVQVETVVVGDADMDAQLGAVVQAAREALVNAARHAGVSTVSLYAEAEPERVSVFVRDRGVGFDRQAVPDDRHGVQGSIVGRMERHGGAAAVRTAPGSGTEVELTMARNRS